MSDTGRHIEVTEYPLERADEALYDLRSGQLVGAEVLEFPERSV